VSRVERPTPHNTGHFGGGATIENKTTFVTAHIFKSASSSSRANTLDI